MQSSRRAKWIGNRAFYAMVLAIVVPIIIQNAISNFVNLLDNIMVGRIGTEQMSGVAIANQLFFVFNITIFGAVSGAGIFTAQFYGANDLDGVRASFRYKIYISLLLTALAFLIFKFFGPDLVKLYLNESGDPARVERTLGFSMEYLQIMLLGLIPFALTQSYASSLRETGKTTLPMIAGIVAVVINMLFNYLLIFGKFGFPMLGVRGAAYATILSRYVELAIVIVYAHTHQHLYPFIHKVFHTLSIPAHLVKDITLKGMPLLANELLWSLSMATLSQVYSLRGLDVVAALNISNTIYNLFSVVFLSLGSAAAIIVGQSLGANEIETAKDQAWKIIFFSVTTSVGIGLILVGLSHWIPMMYNTTSSVHAIATKLILVSALIMPCNAFVNCSYFIMRSGGKTGVTFLFDCVFSWTICIPLAYVLAHLTQMNVVWIFLCVQLTEFIKAVVGYILIQKGIWVHNIVKR